jgi:glycosyltransferase involved in cell wall biosynthesis
VVTSCHGSDISVYPHIPGHEHFAVRLPEIFGRASAVHCVSESLVREATELGLDCSKARVIRQGVDPELFRPGGERRDPEVLELVSIAWLRWVKGFEWALVALRALIDAGVPARLTILGGASGPETSDAGERERILHTVRDLGLEASVRLTGEASSAEVSDCLRTSDALLVPSLNEGLPTVVLEAMASGVPVVATDCGGVSEALTDGVEGFLVPPREPDALAAALARLWRDRELRDRMGRAGRRTATSRFALTRQIDEFQELYRELATA